METDTGSGTGRTSVPAHERLKVFISYSRHDVQFAAEIRAGLEYDGGFETLIDSQSIYEGEEWKARISALIAEAGTVVVVLSAHWVASEICQWELEQAWLHAKRVVPVQYVALTGVVVPPRLAAFNYVRFDTVPGAAPRLLMEGMQALRRVLVTDLGWVREHARLMAKAAEWDAARRVANRMLVGSDIAAAKRWLEARPTGAPEPTELHHDFIAASEQADAARLSVERQRAEKLRRAYERARAAGVVASVAALLATGAGLFAHREKLQAEAAEQRAARERDGALLVQSRHLADIAAGELGVGDAGTAMQLALAGLPEPEGLAEATLAAASAAAPAAAAAATASAARGPGRPYLPDLEGRLIEAVMASHERRVLAGHSGAVLGVAYSADAKRLATSGDDRGVRLWDTERGEQLSVMAGGDGPATAVAFMPDGQRLVVGSGTQAQVIDVATGRTVHVLAADADGALSLAVSADGRRIVTGGPSGVARVWDAATGQLIATLTGHSGPVSSVAIDRTGSLVLTGSDDATAALWSVAEARRLRVVKGHALALSSVSLSADGSRFATGSVDQTVRLWDTASGQPRAALGPLGQPVAALVFSPDGTQLAVGGVDGSVQVLDAASGEFRTKLVGHTAAVTALAWAAPGAMLASASKDGTARVWSLAPGLDSQQFSGLGDSIPSVAINADGRRVIAAVRGGPPRWLPDQPGAAPVALAGQPEAASVALSADGSRAAAGAPDGSLRWWDVATGQIQQQIKAHEKSVGSVAFSEDGHRLASGADDLMARVWDSASGQALAVVGPHATRVTAVYLNRSGDRLLTGSGTTARLWNAATGQAMGMFGGVIGQVRSVALSPDGTTVAAGSRDASVRLWNVAAPGVVVHHLQASGGGTATRVVFSADGSRLVSAWSDGHVRIWDARTGQAIADAKLHDVAILDLGVASKGQRLVTADAQGTLRLSPLFDNTAALTRWARSHTARCLGPDQLKTFHLAAPPRWCITGPAGTAEPDASRWQPLWPYQAQAAHWRTLQMAADRGEAVTWSPP